MAIKKFNAVDGLSVGGDIIIDVVDSNANVTANSLSVTNSANLGNVGNVTITGGQPGQILLTDGAGNLQWVDNIPTSTTYTANSIAQTGGVYVTGDLYSIQVFGDYADTDGVYVLTDGTGTAPAWYIDIDYLNVTNFNLVTLNINYTQNSGHTIYVQLYNNNTSLWDNIGTYTGLGSYYAFALQVIDDTNYINASASDQVKLRLYHSNGGNASHTTSIDYAALELTNQGPQGPRGPTGATGNVGPGVASGGTTGQLLIKNSNTNYDTTWSSSVPQLTITGNAVAGNISTTGIIYNSSTTDSTGTGTGSFILDGGASIAKDLWVGGTLHVPNLDVTTYTQLTVDVPLLYLSSNTVYPYNYDIGFYGHFKGNPANNYQHTGFVRNYTNDEWYLFSNIATEPGNSVIDLANANIIYDSIRVGNIKSYGNVTVTGNITVANANLGNLATSNYFSGDGSLLSNLTGANVTGTVANANYATYSGTVLTNAQPNITSVGTLTSLSVSGNANVGNLGTSGLILATGNVTGGNITTAGQVISSVSTGTAPLVVSSTTKVANLNADLLDGYDTAVLATANTVVVRNADANITANYFIGNGSQLTGIDATSIQNGNSNVRVSANGNVTFGVSGNSNVIIVTGSGVNVAGYANITGSLVAGNVSSTSELTVSGNAVITGNLTVNGSTIYSNVTTMNIKDPIIELGGTGNSSPLSSNDGKDRGTLLHVYDTGAGAQVDKFIGWDNSNAEFAFGSNVTVTNEVVTFNTLGNIRAGYFLGNVAGNISGNLSVPGSNTQVIFNDSGIANAVSGLTFNKTTGLLTVTANISAGNVSGGNLVSANYFTGILTTAAQPNITSVGTLTSLTVSGNVSSGNLSGTSAVVGTYSELTGSTATTSSTTQTAIATFSATAYGAAKFIVQATEGTNRHITELLVTHNGTDTFVTEYGIIKTNTSVCELTADISSGNVRLLATSATANSTVYRVSTNLIKV